MQWYDRNCKICNKPFKTYKRNKYVDSIPCQIEYNRRYMRELMRKKRAEEKIMYTQLCVVCRNEFKTSKLKVGYDVVCFDCRLNKRKIFERDYLTPENSTGELKPAVDWADMKPEKPLETSVETTPKSEG